jgi:hypothetical protein
VLALEGRTKREGRTSQQTELQPSGKRWEKEINLGKKMILQQVDKETLGLFSS